MTKLTLPKNLNPFRFAREKKYLEASFLLSEMTRVRDMLLKQEGQVEFSIAGKIDLINLPVLHGTITVNLCLECQRCLKPMDYPLNVDFNWVPIKDDKEIEDIPSYYDSIECKDEDLNLLALIEDELILNLPTVPMHENPHCVGKVFEQRKASEPENSTKASNPFEVLKHYKHDSH